MYILRLLTLSLVLLLSSSALSYADYELSESKRCSSIFPHFERRLTIPKDILHSISLQESGKKHSRHNIMVVWPWTINVEGKGYYFKTKNEAIRFTRKQLAAGKSSIDVGCMQINLKHHPKAFASLEQAFSPQDNIAYGALFLKQKYDQLGNWEKAVGHYHSADTKLSKNYQQKVHKINESMYSYKNLLYKYTFSPEYRLPRGSDYQLAKGTYNKKPNVRVAVGYRKDDDLFRRKSNTYNKLQANRRSISN
jgi:soluble lytic murein transglycosylase-like protein